MATEPKTVLGANDADDDFKPSPREAYHTDPQLCKELLRKIESSVPVEIRSSKISMGSGLFAGTAVEAGREIYRSTPLIAAINAGNPTFCHHCLKDTTEHFEVGASSESKPLAKACAGCKVATFCSKQCQKAVWASFHKDECKILRSVPTMKAQHLLAHRLMFWQQRKLITTLQGKAISFLETHFNEYADDEIRATEITDIALAIREATGAGDKGPKASMGLLWKIVPALRANCVGISCPANLKHVGYALDLVTAAINHSCDPNAHVFFEGRELRVRSLKKIAPGDEITICYLDSTLDVAVRQQMLKREHFFDCSCKRCKSETKAQLSLAGARKNLPNLHQAQTDMRNLIHNAVRASKYPGVYPAYEDLAAVDAQLRTITAGLGITGTTTTWPEHMDPLPLIRLSLAMLYLKKGPAKTASALRNALRGKLISTRRAGPEWVNEMMSVISVLLVAGSLPPEERNREFPDVEDIRTVTYGYLSEACREAARMFGDGAEYTKGMCEMLGKMVARDPEVKVGSKEFAERFGAAQGRLMAWAAVPEAYAVVLSGV